MSISPTTPPLLGILETALYAEDLDAARTFWEGVMGLTVIQTVPGRHVFFRANTGPQAQVLLVFDPAATATPPGPDARLPVPPHGSTGPGHFCLASTDIPGWRAHLEAHGVAIEADFRWPTGARSIYMRDPAGNSIEIAEPSIWA